MGSKKSSEPVKIGNYDKVLVGVVDSFTRGPLNTSTGIFREFFTTKKIEFKLASGQLYSEDEQKLLTSMIVVPGIGQKAVVLVLDENNYVSLVRNEL